MAACIVRIIMDQGSSCHGTDGHRDVVFGNRVYCGRTAREQTRQTNRLQGTQMTRNRSSHTDIHVDKPTEGHRLEAQAETQAKGHGRRRKEMTESNSLN